MLRVLDRLGPRFAWRASGGASDFAHCSESRQSHKAVSSSCRGRFHARSSTDYPFTSSCSPRPDRQDAVSFRCLAGSTARKGLAPFGVCAFPSARARVSSPAARRDGGGRWNAQPPWVVLRAAGEDTRAPAFGSGPVSFSWIRPSSLAGFGLYCRRQHLYLSRDMNQKCPSSRDGADDERITAGAELVLQLGPHTTRLERAPVSRGSGEGII